jgi:uncharacterized membrane protein (Fun14 family)
VIGGFLGIAVPLEINHHVLPKLGLGLLAGLIVGWTVFVLARRRQVPGQTGHLVPSPD